jgi:hypothetical protein
LEKLAMIYLITSIIGQHYNNVSAQRKTSIS